jgi:hypothetical protein
MERGQSARREVAPEYTLLEASCAYAASKLGAAAVAALLEALAREQETIGLIASVSGGVVLCSSPLGDVIAPARIFPASADSSRARIGSSWFLTVLPLQTPRAAWRAICVKANDEGWKCARPIRGTGRGNPQPSAPIVRRKA